ncbi:MAG TPA: hypothetical protein PKN69_08455, partial [Candidatus Latescibacteria bacterium]|nr:hypothetical protein [Candidatus Latescibacterota bacterium]
GQCVGRKVGGWRRCGNAVNNAQVHGGKSPTRAGRNAYPTKRIRSQLWSRRVIPAQAGIQNRRPGIGQSGNAMQAQMSYRTCGTAWRRGG